MGPAFSFGFIDPAYQQFAGHLALTKPRGGDDPGMLGVIPFIAGKPVPHHDSLQKFRNLLPHNHHRLGQIHPGRGVMRYHGLDVRIGSQ